MKIVETKETQVNARIGMVFRKSTGAFTGDFLLCCPQCNKVVLIDMDGERWTDPRPVEDPRNLTDQEFVSIFGIPYEYRAQLEGSWEVKMDGKWVKFTI